MSMKQWSAVALMACAGAASAAGSSWGGIGFDDGTPGKGGYALGPLTVQAQAKTGYAAAAFSSTFGAADHLEIQRSNNDYGTVGMSFVWQDAVQITGGVGAGQARLTVDSVLQEQGVAGDAGVTLFLFDHMLTPNELSAYQGQGTTNNPFGVAPVLDAYHAHVSGLGALTEHQSGDFSFQYGQTFYLLALYNGGSGNQGDAPSTLSYDAKVQLTVLNNAQAVVQGNVPAAAVPEPSSVAMLLAGLGIVGVAARRRRV